VDPGLTPAEQAEARRLLQRESSHRLQGFGEGGSEADAQLTDAAAVFDAD
jgi:hypothetical protein